MLPDMNPLPSVPIPGRPGDQLMYRRAWFVCVAALFLVGCGGPPAKLDTTTDATTDASLKAMTAGLSDAEKKQFQEDCDLATLSAQFSSKPPKDNSPKEKLETLNGLTADEIRSRAAVVRAKLSQ
jgi:hypothetical protein